MISSLCPLVVQACHCTLHQCGQKSLPTPNLQNSSLHFTRSWGSVSLWARRILHYVTESPSCLKTTNWSLYCRCISWRMIFMCVLINVGVDTCVEVWSKCMWRTEDNPVSFLRHHLPWFFWDNVLCNALWKKGGSQTLSKAGAIPDAWDTIWDSVISFSSHTLWSHRIMTAGSFAAGLACLHGLPQLQKRRY